MNRKVGESQKRFDDIYDKVVEELRGNLSNEEYRELITLEYVITQGYDKKGDTERLMELRDKKYEKSE
jgi:hypothetical protein